MQTPEAPLKKFIADTIKCAGGYAFKPNQMGFGDRTVDILACYKGCFIAFEVKRPGKMPTAKQYNTLDLIDAAGGHGVWFDSQEEFLRWWERFVRAAEREQAAAEKRDEIEWAAAAEEQGVWSE